MRYNPLTGRTHRCAALLLGSLAPFAMAQDPVTAAPGQCKVEFEDDDVRVLRVVYVTGGRIRITLPDGRVGEPRLPPGQVMRHPAGSHAIENLGDAPFELVLVELKKIAARRRSVPRVAPSPAAVAPTRPGTKAARRW